MGLGLGVAQAQELVRGKVVDEKGHPMEMAVVVLVNPQDSTIAAHTAAGKSGQYVLKGTLRGEYWLQVHMVGYNTEEKTLAVPHIGAIDFALKEDTQDIEAVRIAARKKGTKVEGKTVKYNIAAFLTGNERTLGDLLKALPGLKVAKDGTVTAQGEKVSKILFNGQDLYGGNVGLATKNVDAAVADSVRVVHGYSEYSLYGGFKNSDETVIDVGVKKGMMDRLNGKVEAGGGYKNLYTAKGNAMYIGTQDMFSLMASGNNTGEQSFTYEDLLTFIGGIESRSDYSKVPRDLWSIIYPSMDTYKMETGMAAVNYHHHKDKKLKLKTGILGTWGNRDAESRTIYETLIGPKRGETMETFSESSTRVRALYGMGSVSYTPTEQLLFGGSLNASVNHSWSWGNYRDLYNGSAPLTKQNKESYPYNISGSAFATIKLGEHLIEGELAYLHKHEAPSRDIIAEQVYLPIVLIPQDGLYQFALPEDSRTQEVNAKLGSKIRLNEKQFVELALHNQWAQLEYSNRVETASPLSLRPGYGSRIGNNATMATNDTYLSATWNKNKGFFQAKLGGELHALQYDFRRGEGLDTKGLKWFATPVAKIKLQFTPMHTLTLKGKIYPDVLDTRMHMAGDWNLGYRRLTQGTEGMKIISLQPSVELRYGYFSDTRNLRMHAHARYTRSQFLENAQEADGLLQIQRPIGLGAGHNGNGGIWVGKTLWAFWEVGMYSQYSYSEQTQLYRKERVEIKGHSVGLFPDVRTTYKFPLNVAFGGQWQWKTNRYGEASWRNYQFLTSFFELDFKLGDWRAKASASYQQSLAGEGADISQWNLNASLEYMIWKNLSVVLKGDNLLSLDRLKWQEVNYGSLYRTERMYRTIPGFVVAKLRWEFGKQPKRGKWRH